MNKKLSVFSRFRLASVSIMAGIVLVGAAFYAMVNSHFLETILSQTMGPYSDALAQHGFASDDPEIWQKMAERHEVGILIEPVDGEALAYDADGRQAQVPLLRSGQVRAVRTAEDGTRITLFWTTWSFQHGHYVMMGGLLVMVVAVVGSGFWFLQRQLRPLVWLHSGVDAVARGDFKTRVPIVRRDEIGQVAEAFNAMTARVGEMIDDRERLLADVSHELRSPIARMKVALEFVPEGGKRDALARDLREMERLIAVLLEREALRSRTGRLEGTEVDLGALAGQVAATFADRKPGVEVVRTGETTLYADPDLMKLLVQNLVDNAVKFSREDSAPVEVRLESRAAEILLRVRDDGIGIPADGERKLFEPFVKADPARGHRVGYGIGLNLCQRIVQLHAGTIELQPRNERGTEAVVTLPRG